MDVFPLPRRVESSIDEGMSLLTSCHLFLVADQRTLGAAVARM